MEQLTCPACKLENQSTNDLCLTCHYPFHGTDKEKSALVATFVMKKGVVSDAQKLIKSSRNWLFIIAGFSAISALYAMYINSLSTIDTIFNIVVVSGILLCALFLEKRPVILAAIPLFLIVMTWVLSGFVDPSNLLRGIIFKTIIVIVLGKTIINCYKAKQFEDRYGKV